MKQNKFLLFIQEIILKLDKVNQQDEKSPQEKSQ